jgi:hypothetical protein
VSGRVTTVMTFADDPQASARWWGRVLGAEIRTNAEGGSETQPLTFTVSQRVSSSARSSRSSDPAGIVATDGFRAG